MLSIANLQGNNGQTIQAEVLLEQVSDGISGFVVDVTVQDSAIAQVQSVTVPNYGFQISTGAPGPSISVLAADANELLEGTFSSAVLITLDIELLSMGSTSLLLNVNQLDSDSGVDLRPVAVINHGLLTVN